jgi:hypothetical protein
MTALRYRTADKSPREQRPRKFDFTCECGEQWDTPGHIWWVCRMYCTGCGEIVEAE